MTDANAGEALIEQEVAAVAPVLDEAPGEVTPPDPADVDVVAAPSADAPAALEIEYPIGATRQSILDHFIDTEGDQSMAQIKAALPNVLPGTVEACVRREWEAGRLLRVSSGVYRLAPPEPPERPSTPPPPTPDEEAI
jgi:hypothetical protein